MPNLPVKSPQQLLQMATDNAKAVKKLSANITVASGAVVGGPASPPPTTAAPPSGSLS